MNVAYPLIQQLHDSFRLQLRQQHSLVLSVCQPHLLGEPLLNDAVKLISNVREEHEQAWKQYGYTLMSDGWMDRRADI